MHIHPLLDALTATEGLSKAARKRLVRSVIGRQTSVGTPPPLPPGGPSHFTYCHSGGKLLICDIQGVADKYTDPQIHRCPPPRSVLCCMVRDGCATIPVWH